MSSSPNLLTVPPEIREIVLSYLFDTPGSFISDAPVAAGSDKQGSTKTTLAAFYTRAGCFDRKILEFLADPELDPRLKYNIAHIAVDDGDVMDLPALKHSQVNAILSTFTRMPRLRALEFRAWARTDNAHYLTNLNKLYDFWKAMKKACGANSERDLSESSDYCSFVAKDTQHGLAMDAMQNAGVHISVQETKEKYLTTNLSRLTQPDDVHLYVCNLLLSKDANEGRKLDCAKTAVVQRMKVAGATHIKDDNVLERLTW